MVIKTHPKLAIRYEINNVGLQSGRLHTSAFGAMHDPLIPGGDRLRMVLFHFLSPSADTCASFAIKTFFNDEPPFSPRRPIANATLTAFHVSQRLPTTHPDLCVGHSPGIA
jgi:hypothetical protein